MAGLAWLGNFYEHRLRPDELIATVLQYLHLNPYHARFVEADAV